MSEDEEQDRRSYREVKVRRSYRKAIDTYISKLHYQVTDSSRKGYNSGSL